MSPRSPEVERIVAEWSHIRGAVFLSSKRFIGRDVDVEDPLHEAFAKIWSGHAIWDPKAQPDPARYVFGLVRGLCLNQRRTARGRSMKSAEVEAELPRETESPEVFFARLDHGAYQLALAHLREHLDDEFEKQVLERIVAGAEDLLDVAKGMGADHQKVRRARARIVEQGQAFVRAHFGAAAEERRMRRAAVDDLVSLRLTKEMEDVLAAYLAAKQADIARELAEHGTSAEALDKKDEDMKAAWATRVKTEEAVLAEREIAWTKSVRTAKRVAIALLVAAALATVLALAKCG